MSKVHKSIAAAWSSRRGTLFCLVVLASLFAPFAPAEILPAARSVDWTPGVSVGVPAGIPTNRTRQIIVTSAPYQADNTGATDATAAIQSAVDAAVAGDIVYLPAGKYRLNNAVYVGPNKHNITIRGAGNSTIIDSRGNTAFRVGSGSDYNWSWPPVGNVVSAGMTKGSTQITIGDTQHFSVGQIAQIAVGNQENDDAIKAGATPVIHVSGYEWLRRQKVRITAKTATTLTFTPALYFTADPGLPAKVNVAQFQGQGVGIESMWIDGQAGSMIFPIFFEQCYGCWIKEVKITNTNNYGIYLTDSLMCEVRKCDIRTRKNGGSNGAGVLIGGVTASLFEDNIVVDIFPPFEINFSCMGNVVAYNFIYCPIGGNLNTNHGPHNSFNLYEGNITPNMQADGYFGSASDDTFFRNWIHGTDPTRTQRTFMISLNRFTRNYSFVGNIIGEQGMPQGGEAYSYGNPNMGNASYSGTAKPSAGDFWRDWKATGVATNGTSQTAGSVTLNSGTAYVGQYVMLRWNNNENLHTIPALSSVIGNVLSWTSGSGNAAPANSTIRVFLGPGGYQELDMDVERTTFLKGNYFYGSHSIPSAQGLGGETLPNSLYRSSKPGWFGTLAWPPFDPTNPAPSFDSIPAGYRFVNSGSQPAADSPAAPANVRIYRR